MGNMLRVIREQAGTSTPVLITGDFNADINEPGPQEILQSGFELAKNSWVDAIFYSRDHWLLADAAVGSAAQSDHGPIIADLQMRRSWQGTSRTTGHTAPRVLGELNAKGKFGQ